MAHFPCSCGARRMYRAPGNHNASQVQVLRLKGLCARYGLLGGVVLIDTAIVGTPLIASLGVPARGHDAGSGTGIGTRRSRELASRARVPATAETHPSRSEGKAGTSREA